MVIIKTFAHKHLLSLSFFISVKCKYPSHTLFSEKILKILYIYRKNNQERLMIDRVIDG